ncbi:MAG: hypothetical protein C7B46_12845 [Sulfobacillus benefaciens]|uniref:Uncharacterized protein n=1 Tax=Sulfobacillus benefaciens TaxID=453960 RepID=A0A2T2XED0_9FIRM|nr:MAG: hypothetical protein C7B46_12845 [Sulfobacillus benefaciens]
MLLYIHNDAWAFRVTVFEKDSGTNIFVHDGATIGTHDVSDWATWPNWRSVLVMVSRMVYWLDWWFPRTYRQPLGPVLKNLSECATFRWPFAMQTGDYCQRTYGTRHIKILLTV